MQTEIDNELKSIRTAYINDIKSEIKLQIGI